MPTWVSLFCRIKLRSSTSASQRKNCTEQVCWLVNINYIQPNASVRRSRQKQWFLPKLVFRNSGSEEFRNTKSEEDSAASIFGDSKLFIIEFRNSDMEFRNSIGKEFRITKNGCSWVLLTFGVSKLFLLTVYMGAYWQKCSACPGLSKCTLTFDLDWPFEVTYNCNRL